MIYKNIKVGNNNIPITFDFHAILKIEEETGKSLTDGSFSELSASDMFVMAYYGMESGYHHAGKEFDKTKEDVQRMLSMKEVMKIIECFESFMPEVEENTALEKNGKTPTNGQVKAVSVGGNPTGTNSKA